MLARNRCDSAKFSITEAHMESADRLVARVWQEFVFVSRSTPPTYVTTEPGRTYVINMTGRLTLTQVLREEWVRSGATWRLDHAEAVSQKAVMVR